ncbi:hypothetical protein N9417_02535 [Pseudomonadales bacterium]|nr:hypothetical protein [Pseudomonadales bacterium]
MWQHLIEGEAPDGFGFILKAQVHDVGYRSVTITCGLKAGGAIGPASKI